ncbi:MAG TPA: allantoate amidohydrolase [Chitinophagaceae bacterium]|jgi:hydantoinase/carbamoylase family amidase
MNEYLPRAQNIMTRIEELASVSEESGIIARTFGTNAFLEGSRKVAGWMEKAGLQTRTDNMGNVRGRLRSSNPNVKTLVIASHIDTVINAGRFDGPLGVLLGLDLLEQLMQAKTPLPFHIELIAFSDEEGVRFHTTYLGSKVVAGSFDHSLLEKKDATGTPLKDVITAIGGDAALLAQDRILPGEWLGYFEVHIEQGPVLYEKHIPVAVVKGIAGQKRSEIIFKGTAGHAGTVPMDMRRDALCCASEFILAVEQWALENKAQVVATVGKLHISHAASNTIPGEVSCTLDLRSNDPTVLSTAYTALQNSCKAVSTRRGISFEWNLVQETTPVACDAGLNDLLVQSIRQAGHEPVELVSGAGHDGVPISQVSPIAMLFVRCFEGISHHPQENVELKDLAAAVEVSANFIHQLIKQHTR